MDFFDKTGKMALGSRLRLLTAKVTEDAAKIYGLYDVEFSPKWFPVFFVLSEGGRKTITEITEGIGHSQPSVTKIVKEMADAGLVRDNLKSADKRRNVVGLTDKGMTLAEKNKRTMCGCRCRSRRVDRRGDAQPVGGRCGMGVFTRAEIPAGTGAR